MATLPIASTTSIPPITFPKTVCLPISQGVSIRLIKNCDPFVFGPLLIARLISQDGWEIKEIRKNSVNCNQEKNMSNRPPSGKKL